MAKGFHYASDEEVAGGLHYLREQSTQRNVETLAIHFCFYFLRMMRVDCCVEDPFKRFNLTE
jgi:hypothetical protein